MEEITKAKDYLEKVMDNIETEKYYGQRMPNEKIDDLGTLFMHCNDMVKYLEPHVDRLIIVKTRLNTVVTNDN